VSVCAEIDRDNSTVVNWLVGTKLYVWSAVQICTEPGNLLMYLSRYIFCSPHPNE
jgi:hypothetical protein